MKKQIFIIIFLLCGINSIADSIRIFVYPTGTHNGTYYIEMYNKISYIYYGVRKTDKLDGVSDFKLVKDKYKIRTSIKDYKRLTRMLKKLSSYTDESMISDGTGMIIFYKSRKISIFLNLVENYSGDLNDVVKIIESIFEDNVDFGREGYS